MLSLGLSLSLGGATIAVTPGMQFPWQAVQKMPANTAGVLGLK